METQQKPFQKVTKVTRPVKEHTGTTRQVNGSSENAVPLLCYFCQKCKPELNREEISHNTQQRDTVQNTVLLKNGNDRKTIKDRGSLPI